MAAFPHRSLKYIIRYMNKTLGMSNIPPVCDTNSGLEAPEGRISGGQATCGSLSKLCFSVFYVYNVYLKIMISMSIFSLGTSFNMLCFFNTNN